MVCQEVYCRPDKIFFSFGKLKDLQRARSGEYDGCLL